MTVPQLLAEDLLEIAAQLDAGTCSIEYAIEVLKACIELLDASRD